VAAVDIPEASGAFTASWAAQVEGEPFSMIAADDKLFVSTNKGEIYCFAGDEPPGDGPRVINEVREEFTHVTGKPKPWKEKTGKLLLETKSHRGYCVLLGIGDGQFLDAILEQSKMNLIVLEPDAKKVALHRRRLDDAGIYGERVSVLTGDLFSIQLPPYLAHLVISQDLEAAGFGRGREFAEKIFHSLRPYGGLAALELSQDQHKSFAGWVVQGSALLVDGKVYIGDEYGDITVFQHSTKCRVLNSVNMGGRVDTTPIVANDVLYIATKSYLFAIQEPSAASVKTVSK